MTYNEGGLKMAAQADCTNVNRKILFVCLGNICRSPTAEAVLKHLIQGRKDRDQWEIDSAGILNLHEGLRSDSRGLKVLEKHGISNHHRARQVRQDDFRYFDVIMASDYSNVKDLKQFEPKDGSARAEIKLLGSFDPKGIRVIGDPYPDGDMVDFEHMFEHIYRCCEEFLKCLG